MGSIYKYKNNMWRAQVSINGSRKTKIFKSKKLASLWVSEKTIEKDNSNNVLIKKTLGEALKRYSIEKTPEKKGYKQEIKRINALLRYDIAHIYLNNLTTENLEDWKKLRLNERSKTHPQKLINPSTCLKEIHLISAVLERARKTWKWIDKNPMRDVEKPRKSKPRNRRISSLEINKILEALNYSDDCEINSQKQYLAIAFLLAIETAMRQGEIWSIKWENVDFNNRKISLYDTKNGTNREVPLSQHSIYLLKKLPISNEGKVFKFDQLSSGTIFRNVLKKIDIKDLTFHDTRHEAISRLSQKLQVLDLAKMVGHKDTRSLMVYYNPTPKEIAQKLDS